MAKPLHLTKTKLIAALQCSRRLWLETHEPQAARFGEPEALALLNGREVGTLARSVFPDGLLIRERRREALLATAAAMKTDPNRVLFEAAFTYRRVFVRADLLIPDSDGYHLVEVKSAARVKRHHMIDAAIQAWVLSNAGVHLTRVEVWTLDTSFTLTEVGQSQGALVRHDVTTHVDALVSEIERLAEQGRAVVRGTMPAVEMGAKCKSPHPCPFQQFCMASQDKPQFPLTLTSREPKLVRTLAAKGVSDLRQVPPGVFQHPRNERIRHAVTTGKAVLGTQAREAMARLPYPRHFLDFETVSFAVPQWAGTKPYEAHPFQWSCHTERLPGQLTHAEFLDVSGRSPMRAFAETLLQALGDEGAIIVYSAFERSIISALAQRFPVLAPRLRLLNTRLVDLLQVAREHYYHPAMNGRWSIKAVLPTIAPDLDYGELDEVRDGTQAQVAYLECANPITPAARRKKLKAALRAYCARDTYAMVRLAWFFEGRQPPVPACGADDAA